MANRKKRHASLSAPWLTSLTLDPPMVLDDTAYFAGTPEIERGIARIRVASELMPGRRHLLVSPELPNTGVGYLVFTRGIAEATVRAFGLQRLNGIRQFQYLRPPPVRVNGSAYCPPHFSHTRYGHVHDVSAVGALVAAKNGLPLRERTHLRVATLAHDALTPAGGDGTKQLSFADFDEDIHFPKLLAQSPWNALRTRYGLDPDLLTETVKGNGLLGRLLDLCDKIGYVARDTGQFVSRYGRIADQSAFPADFVAILEMAQTNPKICTVWEDIKILNGQVGFTDPNRLATFLKLRALMHRAIYWNPAARHREFVLALLATRNLYRTHALDRDGLWRMTDLHLDAAVREYVGAELHQPNPTPDGVEFQGFATREEAEAELEVLRSHGTELAVIEQAQGQLKSATHLPVWVDGKIVPFASARPELAAEIEQIVDLDAPFRLYALPNSAVRPEFLSALRLFRQPSR